MMGRNWAFWAVVAGCALALGCVLYVLLLAASKPERPGLLQYGVGEMRALQALASPPEQTAHPFVDAAGAERTLADFRGKVVVFNLWATWCQPCMHEMPTLGALAERFKGRRDFAVVAVSVDREVDHDLAARKLREYVGERLAFYIDPRAQMQFTVRTPGLPTTIIFDRDGREVARLAGGADWGGEDAARVIEAALGAALR